MKILMEFEGDKERKGSVKVKVSCAKRLRHVEKC